jgi:hypothetical protein
MIAELRKLVRHSGIYGMGIVASKLVGGLGICSSDLRCQKENRKGQAWENRLEN